MIKDGCLDTVDEVYGFHNIPNFDEGDIRVRVGSFFAARVIVRIKIIGRGGHGSTPHAAVDPIACSMEVINALHTIKSRNIDSRENFTFTICHFESGEADNVIPDEAFMQGTIRSYDQATLDIICERIRTITESTADAMECKCEIDMKDYYPAVVNPEKETSHIKRLAITLFGP